MVANQQMVAKMTEQTLDYTTHIIEANPDDLDVAGAVVAKQRLDNLPLSATTGVLNETQTATTGGAGKRARKPATAKRSTRAGANTYPTLDGLSPTDAALMTINTAIAAHNTHPDYVSIDERAGHWVIVVSFATTGGELEARPVVAKDQDGE